jgi:hypothetical protein
MDRSADVLGMLMGAIFIRSSRIRPTLLDHRDRLPCMACHEHVRIMCIRFLLQDVH